MSGTNAATWRQKLAADIPSLVKMLFLLFSSIRIDLLVFGSSGEHNIFWNITFKLIGPSL